MVVVTHISTSFHQISPSFFHLRLRIPATSPSSSSSSSRPKRDDGFALSIRAYIEKPNSFSSFANKVIGSLPVIGLLARILSDEGGVGRDLVDFAEFRKRVGNKCTPMDSRAFYEFQQRRGKAGEPLYVLLCCWVAAVGAGLLKSEEILEGVTRVSISNDLEFEEQNFIALMTEARQRRAKLNVAAPTIPMELRVEKALEGIYACCFRRGVIEEEDEELLQVMLTAVFPSVEKSEIERIIKEKANRVAQGGEEENLTAEKRLPKEAIQMQMKDLEFLQQQSIES
uniref:Photosystem I assembly factor PSA3, chloroplastic n=1 Tax=Noccaea caerulescens TaxID=107243 RepID=A0A1J3I390_NOCCA